MPAISVIIPTYNRLPLLRRAVECVLDQTFDDWELLVVDDASTDGTSEYLSQCTDPRVRPLRNPANRGAQESRNLGIRHARGEFVCFLDSDDLWVPEKLALQMDAMNRRGRNAGVVYSYCGIMESQTGRRYDWQSPDCEGDIYGDILARPFIDFITPMIRRECLHLIGPLDPNVPSYQEWDTFIRIARNYIFVRVPHTLAYYRLHNGATISKDRRLHTLGYLYVVKKHEHEILRRCGRPALAYHYLVCAKNYCRLRDPIPMARCLGRCLQLSPSTCLKYSFMWSMHCASSPLRRRLRDKPQTVHEAPGEHPLPRRFHDTPETGYNVHSMHAFPRRPEGTPETEQEAPSAHHPPRATVQTHTAPAAWWVRGRHGGPQ
ncbi:MAG: glycosyltransferase family 2 protein [bacterium]